jgi:uncharacterized protein (DUF1810 family)
MAGGCIGTGERMSIEDGPGDPHALTRFVLAQEQTFRQALGEIGEGRKRSHWMWFVFPQFEGLGLSPKSRQYAIRSLQEAKAYLAHPILGPRLIACCDVLLQVQGRTAHEIFGAPDDQKLQSCATLFGAVSAPASIFDQILSKYFSGQRDARTLSLLALATTPGPS